MGRAESTVDPSWAVRFRASGLFVFALFGATWAITAASYLGDALATMVRHNPPSSSSRR